MDKVLITGITGNIGTQVYSSLIKHKDDLEIVGGVSNVDRAQRDYPNIKLRRLDFMDPNTYGDVLAGINKIFLMRPPAISNVKQYIFPFLDYIKKVGVEKVVFLSLQGVENNPITPHHKIEKYILKLGIPYVFVRPSFFMENLVTTHRKEIVELNEIIVPAGDGKTSFIAGEDIGEVARLALIDEQMMNQAYEITGESAFSYTEVAEKMTEIIGRNIGYKHPSIIRFIRHRRRYGDKWAFIMVMVGLYSVCRLGKADGITKTLEQLLNRRPMSLDEFLMKHKDMLD